MNDYNPYIRHISKIEYFAKHIEIDAFVNGAYYTVEEEPITTFDSFIEKTELKHIKNSLLEAYSFFNSVKFDGIFFNEMIFFIKRNGYYKNCENYKMLRKKILQKCKNVYEYFIKKSSKVYALIKIESDEREKEKSNMNISKIIK